MPSRRTTRKVKPRSRNQPVGRALKGFADARKPANELLRDIQVHAVAEGIKHEATREAHRIHVSELFKDSACLRRWYYKITAEPTTDATAPAYHRLEMIWATGTDAHNKYQRWLREMGDLWGNWKCLVCEYVVEDSVLPESCPNCDADSRLLTYEEVNLSYEPYYLVGHADGAVPRLNALVEIKTFATGSARMENPQLVMQHTHKVDGKTVVDHEGVWNDIKRPLRSHLSQGLMYLWMCKQADLPFDRIVFLYENKTTQAVKTFEVKQSDRHVQEYLQKLDEVMAYVAKGVTPPRPKLFAKDSQPCKDCPFRTGCWSDDTGQASASVSTRRSRARSEETGRAPAVRTSAKAEEPDAGRARRHHRLGGPGPDRDDDRDDPVERAPRRAARDGGGGRAVGRSGDGQGEGPRFARKRTRRHGAQG